MSDRTTINVPKETHQNAKNVKDAYDETWTDVLSFYRHYRTEFPENPQIDLDVSIGGLDDAGNLSQSDIDELKNELSMANDPGVEIDTERILGRINDLEAQLPKRVAEELRQ